MYNGFYIIIIYLFFLVSSLRLVKTGMAKTVPAILLGPALTWMYVQKFYAVYDLLIILALLYTKYLSMFRLLKQVQLPEHIFSRSM